MRSTIALAVFLSVASVSLASAEAVAVPRVVLPTSNTPAQTQTQEYEAPGITVVQQNAIPYHPCTQAVGWVNGRLRCSN
jgi:hypothetical protein